MKLACTASLVVSATAYDSGLQCSSTMQKPVYNQSSTISQSKPKRTKIDAKPIEDDNDMDAVWSLLSPGHKEIRENGGNPLAENLYADSGKGAEDRAIWVTRYSMGLSGLGFSHFAVLAVKPGSGGSGFYEADEYHFTGAGIYKVEFRDSDVKEKLTYEKPVVFGGAPIREHHKLLDSVFLGWCSKTNLKQTVLRLWFSEEWKPSDYNLFTRNCQNFAHHFTMLLDVNERATTQGQESNLAFAFERATPREAQPFTWSTEISKRKMESYTLPITRDWLEKDIIANEMPKGHDFIWHAQYQLSGTGWVKKLNIQKLITKKEKEEAFINDPANRRIELRVLSV